MKPGHYPLMTNSEYHSGPGISKSHLDKIAVSPAHYFAAYLDPARVRPEPTPAMVQGTAIHTAVLEPDEFERAYVVVPEYMPNRPTDRQRNAKKPSSETVEAIIAWNEFELSAAAKLILTGEQWGISLAVQHSVRKHPRAKQILKKGKSEQTYFAVDPDTGALVKARPDWTTDEMWIADLKSTKNASPDHFYRSVLDFSYHLQPWFYQNVLEAALDTTVPKHWEFIAVEKEPPYAVACYVLPPEVYRAGARIAAQRLQAIVDCKMLDNWPAYSDTTTTLEFPSWAMRQLGCDSAESDFA